MYVALSHTFFPICVHTCFHLCECLLPVHHYDSPPAAQQNDFIEIYCYRWVDYYHQSFSLAQMPKGFRSFPPASNYNYFICAKYRVFTKIINSPYVAPLQWWHFALPMSAIWPSFVTNHRSTQQLSQLKQLLSAIDSANVKKHFCCVIIINRQSMLAAWHAFKLCARKIVYSTRVWVNQQMSWIVQKPFVICGVSIRIIAVRTHFNILLLRRILSTNNLNKYLFDWEHV